MERKTAGISEEPGVRRQEILDTAMSVLMEKGYEAATMRGVVAAMHVVPGLCYRYYESRQVLYDTVIEWYMEDVTHPMVELLREAGCSLDGSLDRMEQLLMQTDGEEEYHHFFHKKENHDLQMLMSVKPYETVELYMKEELRMINEKGIAGVENILTTTSYMLFGVIPVLENDELSTTEKASGIRMIMKRILGLQLS